MGSVPEAGLPLEGGKIMWWHSCPEMLLFAKGVIYGNLQCLGGFTWTAGATLYPGAIRTGQSHLCLSSPLFECFLCICRTHSRFPHCAFLKVLYSEAECPNTLKLFQTFSSGKKTLPQTISIKTLTILSLD